MRLEHAALVILVLPAVSSLSCRAERKPAAIEERARALHRRILSVDTHCDTAMNLVEAGWRISDRHAAGLKGSGRIDLPRMKEGGLDVEFFAAFVPQGPRTPEGYAKAKELAMTAIVAVRKMTADYPQLIGLALVPEDAYRLKRAGRLAAFIGVENGYALGRDLSLVELFYRKGVRYLTLCHTSDNDICDSSTDRSAPQDEGLSAFGRQLVAECNRVGMMVDISHASEKSFYDVLKTSRAPIIASHSSCRAVCDHPRNLTDEMLRALARNGGIVQICFLGDYVKQAAPDAVRDKALKELKGKYDKLRALHDEGRLKKAAAEYQVIADKYSRDRPTVKDVVDHIDHVRNVVGVDYVGIGTDLDGGGGVAGCDDASGMIHVTEELLRRGYSDQEIEKIWGGNFMRVFRRVLALAAK